MLADIIAAANDLCDLLESTPRGLKRRRHAKHVVPGRAKIKAVIAHFFRRQERAVMAAVRPHIATQLAIHPNTVRESISPQGRTFAHALLPRSIQPLSFAATAGETSDYNDAITTIMDGAASTLARELGAKLAEDYSPAAKYLRDNSLSKLTGELNSTSVERLQDALAEAWDAGGDMSSMVAAVRETFEDFSTTRADLIAQTEGNDAYNAGRRETAKSLGMDEHAWETESGDPCPTCVENEQAGWIDIEDEFPSGDEAPTAHPNCFLGSTPVLARGVTAAFRRWYEGEICALSFPSGANFSVTPNHPILTRDGWSAAGRLKPGDYVAQCLGPSDAPRGACADPHFDQVEASIEQIFNALRMARGVPATSVPTSAEAFHGDVQADSKVDVIWATGAMSRYFERFNLSAQLPLSGGQRMRVAFHPKGAHTQGRVTQSSTAQGIVGSAGAGLVERLREFGVGNDLGGTVATLPEPHQVPMPYDSDARNTDPIRHCQDAFARKVRFVELVKIERREFSGHVFNLSTDSGIYLANTIVAHNCECTVNFRASGDEED